MIQAGSHYCRFWWEEKLGPSIGEQSTWADWVGSSGFVHLFYCDSYSSHGSLSWADRESSVQ